MNAPAATPLLRRLLDVFVAPRRLAERLREDDRWFDALLVATVLAAIAAYLQPAENFLAMVEHPVDRMGRPVEVTSSPAEVVRYGRFMALLSALAGHPTLAFALAGLLTLLFSIVGGGRGGFQQYLAVVAHALVIPAVGALLLLAVSALTRQPLALGLAPLAPGVQSGGLPHRLLAGLNPFYLWMIVVVAAGVAALDGRRGWGRAAALLLGLYLLLDVATALLLA